MSFFFLLLLILLLLLHSQRCLTIACLYFTLIIFKSSSTLSVRPLRGLPHCFLPSIVAVAILWNSLLISFTRNMPFVSLFVPILLRSTAFKHSLPSLRYRCQILPDVPLSVFVLHMTSTAADSCPSAAHIFVAVQFVGRSAGESSVKPSFDPTVLATVSVVR